jgi:hypothetical protein
MSRIWLRLRWGLLAAWMGALSVWGLASRQASAPKLGAWGHESLVLDGGDLRGNPVVGSQYWAPQVVGLLGTNLPDAMGANAAQLDWCGPDAGWCSVPVNVSGAQYTLTNGTFIMPAIGSCQWGTVYADAGTAWQVVGSYVWVGPNLMTVGAIDSGTVEQFCNPNGVSNQAQGTTVASGLPVTIGALPGPQGLQGGPGAQGAPGVSSYAVVNSFIVPDAGSNVTVSLGILSNGSQSVTTWMTPGISVYVGDAGWFSVASIPDSFDVVLANNGSGAAGLTVASGSILGPAGPIGLTGVQGASGVNGANGAPGATAVTNVYVDAGYTIQSANQWIFVNTTNGPVTLTFPQGGVLTDGGVGTEIAIARVAGAAPYILTAGFVGGDSGPTQQIGDPAQNGLCVTGPVTVTPPGSRPYGWVYNPTGTPCWIEVR